MRALLAAALALALPAAALAETAEDGGDTLAAARQMQQAMGGEAEIDHSLTAMRPALIRTMVTAGLPLDRAAKLIDTIELPALRAHMPQLLDAQAHIYAKHFTVSDLHAMEAFYRSSAGRKLLANQATIGGEFMAAMLPMMRDIMARATAAAQKDTGAGGK